MSDNTTVMFKAKLLVIKNILMASVGQSLLKSVLSLTPLKANKYFCISMNGNNYGDSVKVLSDYIQLKEPGCEVVWGFSRNMIEKVDCKSIKVQIFTLKYYYHILTSKYIVSNFAMDFFFIKKRKKQVYLETWHGTALKKIGYDMYKTEKQDLLYRWFKVDRIKNMSEMTDILLSGSEYMSKIFREKFLYDKKIYEVGTPRNDIFFKEDGEIATIIKKSYGIDPNNKILLYAPTFRQDGGLEYYNINLGIIKSFLETKFGGEYDVLLRLHPSQLDKEKEFSELFDIPTLNVTSYPDMQELLYITDVLVTDYSSSMFDFMNLKRPIIMYVPDRDTYSRGFYFDIDSLPAVIINNNDEIEEKLSGYNWGGFDSDIEAFLKKIGNKEYGYATEKAYELLTGKTV